MEPAQGQPSGAGGSSNVSGIAAQIESQLMESDTPEREPQSAPAPSTSEPAKAEPAKPEDKPETEPPGDKEEAKSSDEGGIEIDEDAPLFELTRKAEDGSDITEKLSLKDLKKGRMLESDYRRKTAEVARQREAVQAEIQKGVAAKALEFEQQLALTRELLVKSSAPELQNVNWMALANEDPARYVALKARADALAASAAQIQQQQQQIEAQRAVERQQQIAAAVRNANEQLTKDIPGWGNDAYQAILKDSVAQYGFSPEEVGQVMDARVIKMMRDAAEYRKLKASKSEVEKKLTVLPKVIKPGTTTTKGDSDKTADADALKELRKSGRLDRDNTRIFERFV